MKPRMFNLIAALAVLLFLGACERRNQSHPLYIKAQKYLQDNDFPEAVKCFSQYLKLNPDSAEAHKELGTIYDDRLKSPALAIYHYRRFLELAPADHPDRKTVTSWIDAVEHKYYLQLKDRYNDPEDLKSARFRLDAVREELKRSKTEQSRYHDRLVECIERIKQDNYFIAKLKQQLAEQSRNQEVELKQWRDRLRERDDRQAVLDRALADARAQNLSLQQELERWKERSANMEKAAVFALNQIEKSGASGSGGDDSAARDAVAALLKKIRSYEQPSDYFPTGVIAEGFDKLPPRRTATVTLPPPEKASATPVVPATTTVQPPPAIPKRYYYTVRSGDTLSSISKKFYGSSRRYDAIIEANRQTLPDPSALRPGQVLEIPALPSNP